MSRMTLLVRRGEGPEDFDAFEVDFEAGSRRTLLDALEELRGAGESGLLYRHSCHHGSCGTCGALVDGTPRLLCLSPLESLGPGPLRLEPLAKMEWIAGLAVDPSPLFSSLPPGTAYLRSSEVEHRVPRDDGADSADGSPGPGETGSHRRFEDCIECGLCVAACPVPAERPFVGPAALAAADRDREERPEREEAALAFASRPEGVAACERKFACSRACPQGVAPGRRIEKLRRSLGS